MVVGLIAYERLDLDIRANVEKILRTNRRCEQHFQVRELLQ